MAIARRHIRAVCRMCQGSSVTSNMPRKLTSRRPSLVHLKALFQPQSLWIYNVDRITTNSEFGTDGVI
jgi:hypothetical protein